MAPENKKNPLKSRQKIIVESAKGYPVMARDQKMVRPLSSIPEGISRGDPFDVVFEEKGQGTQIVGVRNVECFLEAARTVRKVE